MSENRISREEAIALLKNLQEQNLRPALIRQRMIKEGFSFSEIYEMQGGEQNSYNNPIGKPKRKNDEQDFYVTKRDIDNYYDNPPFERGGCLSAFLGLQFVTVGLIILFALGIFTDISANSDAGGFLLVIVLFVVIASTIQLFCVYWLWNGERKGYQGLLLLGVINVGLNLVSGDLSSVIAGLVGLSILYFLVNPKSYQLT